MTRILGIDPGSRSTGFGVIELSGDAAAYLASGCVRTQDGDLAGRLGVIFEGVSQVVKAHEPQEMVIERVYVHRNAAAALKLGHARGAAILAGMLQDVPIYEYTPTEVKQAVTGKGNASKDQVQHMIKVLLCLDRSPQSDSADALALAVCHAHIGQTQRRIQAASQRLHAPPRSMSPR